MERLGRTNKLIGRAGRGNPSGRPVGRGSFDGAELGKAVAAHPDDVEAALAVYEEALFPRGESAVVAAHALLRLCLDDHAPFGFVDFLTGALAGRVGAARVAVGWFAE